MGGKAVEEKRIKDAGYWVLEVGIGLTADAGVLALAAAGGGSHDVGWVGIRTSCSFRCLRKKKMCEVVVVCRE